MAGVERIVNYTLTEQQAAVLIREKWRRIQEQQFEHAGKDGDKSGLPPRKTPIWAISDE